LDALCHELLRRDPQARPAGREILRRLQVADKSVAAIPVKAHAMPGTVFVGRAQHLRALEEAYQTVKQGQAASVFIHGSSGIGKTTLVQHFLRELRQRERVLVLEGRCYERESVPYKALDSVVDALTQYLKGLPLAEAAELLPGNTTALARLFPVLRRLEGVRRARLELADVADMRELRRRAFTALRELLARLAEKTHYVVFIDDLQWGDADSANLLAELIRPPAAPPLLLVACYRQEEAETSPLLRALLGWQNKAGPAAEVRQLTLEAMTPSEARELARALTGLDSASLSEAIARESKGNPFFIGELALSGEKFAEGTEILLDQVVRARVSRLPEPARRVLEVAAVAGEPIELDVARRAAQLPVPDQAALAVLRAGHLVRMRKTEGRDEIEMYHDRIREVVASELDPEILSAHHVRLAAVMEASSRANPEALAMHFLGAGNPEKAGRYAVTAADQASEALAFDRAARLYQLALGLSSSPPTEVRGLQVKLGDALSNAGRGAEAAKAYLAAVEGASEVQKLEWQRRAASQLLMSGHIDEGLVVTRAVLDAVGMKLAPAPWRALLSLLLGRARVRLRGLRFRERDASRVPADELMRIDTCWSVAQGLGMVDTIHAADFQARHLLSALSAGEKYRIARALSVEAGYHALSGGRSQPHTQSLLRKAAELSEACHHPHAIGLATLVSGMAAFLEGRWKNARELLERGEAILLEGCTGVVWELGTARLMGCASLFFMGQFRELINRVPVLLQDAERRGDLYEATALGTRVAHACSLAADQPEQAQSQVTQAMERWSAQGFHIQHWWSMIAQVEIALYAGEALKAWELLARFWPALRRSLLLRIQYILIESLHHRAATALAVAANCAGQTYQRRRLRRSAQDDAERIERERMPWGDPLAQLIRAGVVSLDGRVDDALALLSAAEIGFQAADMSLYAAAARRRKGQLVAGDEGRKLIAGADAWMAGQQIQNPERMTAMLAPGKWST